MSILLHQKTTLLASYFYLQASDRTMTTKVNRYRDTKSKAYEDCLVLPLTLSNSVASIFHTDLVLA